MDTMSIHDNRYRNSKLLDFDISSFKQGERLGGMTVNRGADLGEDSMRTCVCVCVCVVVCHKVMSPVKRRANTHVCTHACAKQ